VRENPQKGKNVGSRDLFPVLLRVKQKIKGKVKGKKKEREKEGEWTTYPKAASWNWRMGGARGSGSKNCITTPGSDITFIQTIKISFLYLI
jgi:hypothetical protein